MKKRIASLLLAVFAVLQVSTVFAAGKTAPKGAAAGAAAAGAWKLAEAASGKQRVDTYQDMRFYMQDPANPGEWTISEPGLDGILFCKMADYDRDGADEILYGEYAGPAFGKHVVLHMMEKRRGSWRPSASVRLYNFDSDYEEMADRYLSLDYENYKYFLYLYDQGGNWNIVCEDFVAFEYVGYHFHRFRYDGSQFVLDLNFGIEGQNTHVDACLQRDPSLVEGWEEAEEWAAEFIADSEKSGLAIPADLAVTTLFEHNQKDVLPLCAVTMDMQADYRGDKAFLEWRSSGMKKPVPAIKESFTNYTAP